MAFSGISTETGVAVVVKMFDSNHQVNFENEIQTLSTLSESLFVPHIQKIIPSVENKDSILILSPLSSAVYPVLNGVSTFGKHFVNFLTALQSAHSFQIAHR